MSSYNPLASHILSITDGTVFCPHDDSSCDLLGRKVFFGAVIAGIAIYSVYRIKNSPKSARNVRFHVIDLHKNENAVRETSNSSVDENSDTTLRAVESLSTVSVQSTDPSSHDRESDDDRPSPFHGSSTSNATTTATTTSTSTSTTSVQGVDAATQEPPENQPNQPPPFQAGPIGSVDEEPPKNEKVTKSVQCNNGNCSV